MHTTATTSPDVTSPGVVLVTGAGTGIGRATARASARQGAAVVAVGRRPEPLRETAAEAPTAIHPHPADITAEGVPEELVRRALAGRSDGPRDATAVRLS
ncbi:SDR family NAD(P)-dependent oxidoreductase [Streptomyces sp. NPDC014773]|uniref:SDR family NAD(P)-dependent oxidoreductase n=1 Tax=Streptomyces sp. NPDC014773 TaxID=3364908 RepID=UPI0036FE50A6